MISVGIIGGTGYTGKHLLEYCNKHPYVKEITVYAKSSAGDKLLNIFPELNGIISDQTVSSVDNLPDKHDLYFISLPHGEALKYVPNLYKKNKKIIDLGGDYRLNDVSVYEKHYKLTHSSPELLQIAKYGLAEFNVADKNTLLVANPGCYPTSALLPLKPFIQKFSDEIVSVSINSYSGTSGAGKTPKAEMLMSEMDGNVAAYNVNSHRHKPEIEQELVKDGLMAPMAFTTHLLPVARGIYTTSTIHLKKELDEADIKAQFNMVYKDKYFVRMREVPPKLTWVTYTNFCDINLSLSGKTLVITSALDNLVKGASGQAVQNMNQMFGWNDCLGILNSKK